MPIENYASQPLEQTILDLEQEAIDFFEDLLVIYGNLSEIEIEDVIASLKLENVNTVPGFFILRFFHFFKNEFDFMPGKPLFEIVKRYYAQSKYYKIVQALSHFRNTYYTQLTTSNYNAEFTLTAIKSISAIRTAFNASGCEFGICQDQILEFLNCYSPMVIDWNSLSSELPKDLKELSNRAHNFRSYLEKFLLHALTVFSNALILCVDIQAREHKINLKVEDCVSLDNLKFKLQRLDLIQILSEASKYINPAYLTLQYKNQVFLYFKLIEEYNEMQLKHPKITRIRFICQPVNKAALLTDGLCAGTAILLESNLDEYFTATPPTKPESYAQLDALEVTAEIYQRQRNQFEKRQTDRTTFFTHTVAVIENEHSKNFITQIYTITNTILRNSNDGKVKFLVRLNGHIKAHDIAICTRKIDTSTDIVFIDLNYGVFRYTMIDDNYAALQEWCHDIFSKTYPWINDIVVKVHYSKSYSFSGYVNGIEQTLSSNKPVVLRLKAHLAEVNFAARYDDEKRNKIYSLLERIKHGDDSQSTIVELLNNYEQIVNKNLSDHIHGLYACFLALDANFDADNYAECMRIINDMKQINNRHQNELLQNFAFLGILFIEGIVAEKQTSGLGKNKLQQLLTLCTAAQYDSDIINILQEIVMACGTGKTNIFNDNFSIILSLVGSKCQQWVTETAHNELFAAWERLFSSNYALVDDHHSNTSLIASDKPNLRPVAKQHNLGITLLFSQAPERHLKIEPDPKDRQIVVYRP